MRHSSILTYATLKLGVYPHRRLYMEEQEAVRWNIKVSKQTDLSLRTFLGSQGMKKGDLSKFIEQAVRAQLFHRKVQKIQSANANTDPEELQALIDHTARQVRSYKRTKRKPHKR